MTSASAILTIDLAAIRENYLTLRQLMAPGEVSGVVKADAYGLGICPVARTLREAGCRLFFTATLEEALRLRRELPDPAVEIGVLNGLLAGEEDRFAEARLLPVLCDLGQITLWGRFCGARQRPLPAVIQVDTGLTRLGLPPAELRRFSETPFPGGVFPVKYVMSHLACADDPADPRNRLQLERFLEIRKLFPGVPASLAASGGIFLGPDWRLDLARPGISLYGGAPNRTGENPMRPVVRLQARVLQVQEAAAGSAVGYGASYRAAARTRIATVAAGYADGYLRSLGGRSRAHFRGISLPLAGRVSMDMITVDAGAAPDLKPGDMVDLLGPEHGIDALARDAGTIANEILTALGSRYQRVYLEG